MVDALLTLAFVAGLALVSYGAWLAWEPLGYIVGGFLLVTIPVVYARGRKWDSSTG